jgi:hypothetical protein
MGAVVPQLSKPKALVLIYQLFLFFSFLFFSTSLDSLSVEISLFLGEIGPYFICYIPGDESASIVAFASSFVACRRIGYKCSVC